MPVRDVGRNTLNNGAGVASLAALARQEAMCRRCGLYQNATTVVPGEGARHARLMLVGEQPGDHEDRAGKPFVGPAGKMLDRALEEKLFGAGRARLAAPHPAVQYRPRVAAKAAE